MSDTNELSIEARVAARWWADQLRDEFTLDNGDPEPDPMAVGLMAMVQKRLREQVTAAKVDRFEAALAARVQVLLDEGASSYHVASELSVDYGPGVALSNALEWADLPTATGVLPFKTVMWVQPGYVRVSDGYRAGPRDLPLAVAGESDRDAGESRA